MTSDALLLTVAELEQTVILAEHEAGITPPGATRPLFPWEIRAGVRFAAQDDLLETGYTDTAVAVDAYADAIIAALGVILAGITSPTVAAALVLQFFARQPESVMDAAERCADQIADALGGVHGAAITEVLQEAEAQGIPDEVVPDAPPAVPADTRRWHRLLGSVAIAVLWQAFARVAVQAGGVGPAEPARVLDDLRQASRAQAYDSGRQAVHVTASTARTEAAERVTQIAQTPVNIYASELLDSNTCGPCDHIDGQNFATLADALAAYPNGTYKDCGGGDRCRGTLVFVWPEANPRSSLAAKDQPRDGRGRWGKGGGGGGGKTASTKKAPFYDYNYEKKPKKSGPLDALHQSLKAKSPQAAAEATQQTAPPKPPATQPKKSGPLDALAAKMRAKRPADAPAPAPAAAAPTRAEPRRFQSTNEARTWASGHWSGTRDSLTPAQTSALRSYTGDGYVRINGQLRTSQGGRPPKEARSMDAAMDRAPRVPERVEVSRNVGLDAFGLSRGQDPSSLVGRSFTEHGYMSTTVKTTKADATFDGEVTMKVAVPKGAKAIYVSGKPPISAVGEGEGELLLARGTRMSVTAVTRKGRQWIVEVEATQDDLESAA